MRPLRSMMVAMAVSVVAATIVAAQEAPRKLVAPVRGEAAVEYTAPDTRPVGNEVISVLRVKNISSGPIAGFKVEENWYKGNDPVGGDSYRHPRPLPVGEVIEVRLVSPRAAIIGARNQFQFSHANGTIKTVQVKTLPKPVADPAAAKPPAANKPPAKPPVQ